MPIGEGGTRRVGANPESDVLLAVCQVPLSPLLSRDTGVAFFMTFFLVLLPYLTTIHHSRCCSVQGIVLGNTAHRFPW